MRLSFAAIGVLLGACSSMPETNYYILSSTAQAPVSVQSSGGDALGIGRITLADYLRSSGVVMQTNDNQIKSAHYHRWGEPLQRGVRRTLADQLSSLLPEYRVETDEKDLRRLDFCLDIEIERFHALENAPAVLAGRWTLYEQAHHLILASRHFDLEEPMPRSGYSAAVNTQSALVAALGREIAAISGNAVAESRKPDTDPRDDRLAIPESGRAAR